MFSIQFLPSSDTDSQEDECDGLIQIKDFEEIFRSSTLFWDKEKYQNNWKLAIERIIFHEYESALIIDIHNPRQEKYVNWWLMYREEEKIHFQNQLLTSSVLNFSFSKFDPENPFTQISSRETHTEDGEEISEWIIEIKFLEDFYNKIT